MKITEYAISKKTVSWFFTLIIICGGFVSYTKLGKLEFPSFTIKESVVLTSYPGASALEVESEVTEKLEKAIQKMGQLKHVRSISQTGLSIIYVEIQKHYNSSQIPQIWDELRRKVSDIQVQLPPGAGPSMVNDDFGDVYGVFFAITGEGFSYEEIRRTADFLKRELLLVKDVASVETWGEQQEIIELALSRARMAELGISFEEIIGTLNLQNQVVDAGKVKVGSDYIRITPTGAFASVEDLGELKLRSDNQGNLIYLKDVVTIKRKYQDPPRWLLRHNGQPAIGLGIATVDGGNVVTMGRAVKQRLADLKADIPVGMSLENIAYQSDLVENSVKEFIINLVEAVAIVIAALCLTMGLSSGILMGVVLLLTILGTFIGMRLLGVDFQLVSLGALILALGMLVDNAIVVTEGILVKAQQGMTRRAAAIETVRQTAWPLLGATFVAILAFAAIGTSKDTTGEFLLSLFLVMAISLGLSWIFAITLTPLFCVQYLPKTKDGDEKDPYGGRVYTIYRNFLDMCLRHRLMTLTLLFILLIISFAGFTTVPHSFFPDDSRNQFIVNYWTPQGSHINIVSEELKELENHLVKQKGVTGVSTFVGQGALRFLLTYEPQMVNESYGQLLVTVSDYRVIDDLISELRSYIPGSFPDARIELKKFKRGPSKGSQIQIRFQGPDGDVLRSLSEQMKAVMATNPNAIDINDDWRQQVLTVHPKVNESVARRLGITRPKIADALAMNFSGKRVGIYREQDKLIPIMVKAPENERDSVDQIKNVVVFSPATGAAVPLSQIITGIQSSYEDSIIRHRDRRRTITVGCNPLKGTPATLLAQLGTKMDKLEIPAGYSMSFGGEHEESGDAQRGLFQMVPIFFLLMIFTVVSLFNAVRQTVIIFLCLPLVSIGVTSALVLSGEPFGFMCILGYLGLSGMIIKNAVVLIDQIDVEIESGKPPYEAILDSSVSRIRPVSMASLTTILGMLPLLTDVFFKGMSITIIGGLTFGTILTLIIVPLLYALFFRIRTGTNAI